MCRVKRAVCCVPSEESRVKIAVCCEPSEEANALHGRGVSQVSLVELKSCLDEGTEGQEGTGSGLYLESGS